MESLSTQETVIHNGRCVMSALAKNGAVTYNDLLGMFGHYTEDAHDEIKHELNQVLNNGIDSGFILKTGDKYTIPGRDAAVYETDADKGCESKKESPPKSVSIRVSGDQGAGVNIRISTKRKAEDVEEACSSTPSGSSKKKKKMYADDDDGEDFHGFEGCEK